MPPTLPNTLTNGTTADASQVMANLNAINAAVDQATVTSLPGSPYDGQEVYYLADATNGIVWHLKYRSGSSSSYKWENVGGPPLQAVAGTAGPESTTANDQTTSTSFTDLGRGAGPSVTVPLAGDYDVETECHVSCGSAATDYGLMSFAVGASAAAVNDAGWAQGGGYNLARRQIRKTAVAASTALVGKYRIWSSGTGTFMHARLTAIPVRVG